MKIKNTSTRVISVMTKVLLPDEDYDTNSEVVALPSVQALIERGFLTVIGNTETEVKEEKVEVVEPVEKVEEVKAEEKVDVKAEEPKAADTKKADAKKATAKK